MRQDTWQARKVRVKAYQRRWLRRYLMSRAIMNWPKKEKTDA